MKICILECSAEPGLQERLAEEGHEVYVGVNRVDKVDDFKSSNDKINFFTYWYDEDLKRKLEEIDEIDILFRMEHNAPTCTIPNKTIGSIDKTRKLELDREFGLQFIKDLNIVRIPRTTKNIEDIKDFKGDKVVVKSIFDNTDIGNFKDKSIIIFKRDVNYLQHIFKNVIFQEFIEGTEIAIGGFYSNDKFIKPYLHTQEYKQKYPKAMNNLLLSGESGTCGMFCNNPIPEYKKLMGVHEPYFKGHYGFIDINTILDEKGDIWFLEYTPRTGFPTEYELISMLDQSYGKFLQGILKGEDYIVKDKYFASVKVMNLLDEIYTVSVPENKKGVEILNMGCKKVDDYYIPLLLLKELFLVTGYGKTMDIALMNYNTAMKEVNGIGIYWLLDDIGKNWIW